MPAKPELRQEQTLYGVRQLTAPFALRRNTLPGSASVCLAFSTTSVPLTITVVRAPLGNWCGSA